MVPPTDTTIIDATSILEKAYDMGNALLAHKIAYAYLYGSYARGDFHADSDVNILLAAEIGEDLLGYARQKMAIIASRLSLMYDVTVSIFIYPKDHFEKYANVSPFYSDIIQYGIKFLR